MTYVLRPPALSVGGHRRGYLDATIVLVGCGGTGGFVAEAVCRLLLGRRADVFLVDPDRVTPRNVGRQAFDMSDAGRFKAEVLAERLSRRFGRQIGYSVLPYEPRVHAAAFADPTHLALIIGAVDNSEARRSIATTLLQHASHTAWAGGPSPIFWLDAGNGRNSGQVLLGNALRPEQLRRAFDPPTGTCQGLPAPILQRPDLLMAAPAPKLRVRRDCAQAVVEGDQGRTINQMMAALMASYVERLLDGTCTWMATYVDLDTGMLQCVPAEPGRVASLVSVPTSSLLAGRTAA